MLASSNTAGSVASTVVEFLPILDKLEDFNNLYVNDDYGKQYSALLTSLKQALTDLNVVDYTVSVGEPVDLGRMVVMETQAATATTIEGGGTTEDSVVLECLRPGLELEGNIVRCAQVIASAVDDDDDESLVEDDDSTTLEEGTGTEESEAAAEEPATDGENGN